MVKVREDLTGKTFGRLKVIRQIEDRILPCGQHESMWLCECVCGNKTEVPGRDLKNGNIRSCGCLFRELSSDRLKKHNKWLDDVFTDEHGSYRVGFTSNTNKEFYVDEEDYEKVKDYCWCEHVLKNGYHALETHDVETGKTIRMHWIIMGKNYDHKNLNPLDNRKNNLRVATRKQNAQNHSLRKDSTSGFSGVNWVERDQVWIARISVNNKRISLGYYKNKDDAIKARLNAELKYYKEFAPQRHLFEQYGIINKED